jgi:hypothetical protein
MADTEPKIDITKPAPGWKNMPNVFFEYKEWTLGNGVSVRMTQDKMKRAGMKAHMHDGYELLVAAPAFDDRTHYSIMEGVFHAFLRSAGRKFEEPDA